MIDMDVLDQESRASPGDGAAVEHLCAHLENASLIASHAEFEAAFEIGAELGRGAFSVVYAVSCRSGAWGGDERAVKRMSKEHCWGPLKEGAGAEREVRCHDDRSLRRMRDECRVLSELKHPNVIGLYEMFESPSEIYVRAPHEPEHHTAPCRERAASY